MCSVSYAPEYTILATVTVSTNAMSYLESSKHSRCPVVHRGRQFGAKPRANDVCQPSWHARVTNFSQSDSRTWVYAYEREFVARGEIMCRQGLESS